MQKVLYVCSEMVPYTPEGDISNICRYLPQGTQERKKEIRSFMPRYGCINERKNQLHEVIRLSGMNLIISELDRQLVIKVASIAEAHTQVYFIDNEDYFKRKGIYADADGKFYEDNEERAIFFARGVLETVKKLRWAPDVIHCHGWISQLLPLYLKKAYKDDPIFAGSKIVVSLYGDTPVQKFSPEFASKIMFGGITEKDVDLLKASPDGINLAKTAARFADGVILCSDQIPTQLVSYCRDRGLQVLKSKPKSIEDGSYIDEYNAFYDKL
ncbi:MAG: glycogen/starch synthase [Bacteroidales bacterium]|nr:glycogen/starch synthase [Candidatus Cryptobacteroides aphodequi]